jgi:hypothetical protein
MDRRAREKLGAVLINPPGKNLGKLLEARLLAFEMCNDLVNYI